MRNLDDAPARTTSGAQMMQLPRVAVCANRMEESND
jgi:hypothetical protein